MLLMFHRKDEGVSKVRDTLFLFVFLLRLFPDIELTTG